MIRRFHIARLRTGFVDLDPAEAHHVRDVLRLTEGVTLELFDDSGQTATGPLVMVHPAVVRVQILTVENKFADSFRLTIAAAVPKGDRADWMIEKLSELGVHRFVPLVTERSVVLPSGKNKFDRWNRIALEAAKQSRRSGVMEIGELTPVATAIADKQAGVFLSTEPGCTPITAATDSISANTAIIIYVGPEGGWAPGEISAFTAAQISALALTGTILRVETAAITAAAVLLCARRFSDPSAG